MGFGKKTVQDLASLIGELRGKTILVKVDFNVPISDGEITEDLKIRAALPTIQFLLEAEAKVVLMSHLGRPKGKVISEFSLAPVAKRLGELLGDEAKEVRFVPATVGAQYINIISIGQKLMCTI